jgi:hypothetical protein
LRVGLKAFVSEKWFRSVWTFGDGGGFLNQRQILTILSMAALVVLVAPFFAANAASGKAPTRPVTTYNPYFGDLHTHTTYSDAWEGTPETAYAAAIAAGADFMATTDHNFYLTPEEWAMTLQAAANYTSRKFVAIPGYEYWMPSTGEINVYNTVNMPPSAINPANHGNPGNHAPAWDALPTFYDWLAKQPGAVGQWNHPSYMTKDFVDYSYLTVAHDKAMGMIEVYNDVCTESSYVMALDTGWHVMPTANSDTHSPDWISGSEVRTVLLAPSLTSANLYAAMSAGRGYATLDKNLQISYTLNGLVMGSVLATVTDTSVALIHIEDPDGTPGDEITLVEIVSDGGTVVASIPTSGNVVDLNVQLNSDSAHYYYLRVTTASNLDGVPGVTAWTAPVWTGR